MTNEKLIKLALSVTAPHVLGESSSGSVGCALVTNKGNTYTGVCIDTACGMGFCAEHNAIGNMMTNREYRIKKIVATWKDDKGDLYILHPCGRCREFMRQINNENMKTEVILGKNRVVRLAELLPYADDNSKV